MTKDYQQPNRVKIIFIIPLIFTFHIEFLRKPFPFKYQPQFCLSVAFFPPKPACLPLSLFHQTCQMMCVDWLQCFPNNPMILINQQVQFSFWFMVIHDETLICAARKGQRARTSVANGIHRICLTRFLMFGICCESNKSKQKEMVSNLNSQIYTRTIITQVSSNQAFHECYTYICITPPTWYSNHLLSHPKSHQDCSET